MVELILIEQPIIYAMFELEGASCALRQAENVVSAQRNTYADLIALDKLVVTIHVSVVRGVQ